MYEIWINWSYPWYIPVISTKCRFMMYVVTYQPDIRKLEKVCTWYILEAKSMYLAYTPTCRFILVPYYSMVHTSMYSHLESRTVVYTDIYWYIQVYTMLWYSTVYESPQKYIPVYTGIYFFLNFKTVYTGIYQYMNFMKVYTSIY